MNMAPLRMMVLTLTMALLIPSLQGDIEADKTSAADSSAEDDGDDVSALFAPNCHDSNNCTGCSGVEYCARPSSSIDAGCFCKACFHGGNEVRTNNGIKLMKDLKLNDKVLTMDESDGRLKYQPVITDIHHLPQMRATFYKISTELRHITLTSKHYLYTGELKLKRAEDVRVGDEILIHSDGNMKPESVSGVEVVSDVGVFNPVTASGNLIVNDVHASIYADDIPPLTPAVSHFLSWMLRRVATLTPTIHAWINMNHQESGMPYWAHWLDLFRQSYLNI